MTVDAIDAFLKEVFVARLASLDADGAPYIVPVHYVYTRGRIYIHGRKSGRKMDNLARDPRVCFEADEMEGLILSEQAQPCRTNTAYRSVIIRGEAAVLNDLDAKLAALRAITEKYTPQYQEGPIPSAAVEKTAVIEITIREIMGKYNK